MAHDVFISYSTEDKLTADAVCATLEARRIRCWIAPRDVIPGQDYAEQLMRAIRGAGLMVLIFSANANNSPHVMREVERAGTRGIPILPFRIEDVPPSDSMEFYIGTTHWLDALTPPLERHVGKLADRAQLLLAKSGRAVPEREEPRPSVAAEVEKAPAPEGNARPWYRRPLVLLASGVGTVAVVAAIVLAASLAGGKGGAAEQGSSTTMAVASGTTTAASTTTTVATSATASIAPSTTTTMAPTTTTYVASLLWKSEIGGDEALFMWSRHSGIAAVADGVVYAVSGDNHLHALDAEGGEEKWDLEGLGKLASFPAIQDGVVYGDWSDVGFRAVTAESGRVEWSLQTGGGASACPAVLEGVVYCGSGGNWFRALDAKTGREKWRFQATCSSFEYPAISDRVLCLGTYVESEGRSIISSLLYALDAGSGEEKWRLETGLNKSYPAMSDGMVYYGSEDNWFHALDMNDGQEKWKFETGVDILITPVVWEGTVYFECGVTSGYLYALDAKSGQEKWRFKTIPPFLEGNGLAISDGVIYFGSEDKYLHAVDAGSGEERWRFQMSGEIEGAPAVSDGVVYATDGKYVYAVK
jgi:outer membrane protein assembly factor BamB